MTEDFTLRLPNYEGPLDVLLHLIEERRLEITAVSIASVADQFLGYMSAMQSRDPKTLSNFVAVAARLIVLKSRALLPQFNRIDDADESDQNEDDLVSQLRAYQLYKRTARWLLAREIAGIRAFPVQPPPLERPQSRQLPLDDVTLDILARAMQRVVDRWLPPPPVDGVVSRLPFTVNDCIMRIETAISQKPRITFTDVLLGVDLRVEIVINLLALLELLKRNVVIAWQEQAFGDITIEKAPPMEAEWASPDTVELDGDNQIMTDEVFTD
ncbi:MAG: segregation/condensation protein A [Chloroflexi bacterium]|nr:segregation/condensation protein A [Chloroflexota bacterium]MCL5273792.1 segregation/condensation protein A [Chloroflexota bacterium]